MMNLQFDLKFVLRGEGEGKEEEEIVERRREWILWAEDFFLQIFWNVLIFFWLLLYKFPIGKMIENGKMIYIGVLALDHLGKMINTSLKILQLFIFSEIQE